jgi:hypothetical protein
VKGRGEQRREKGTGRETRGTPPIMHKCVRLLDSVDKRWDARTGNGVRAHSWIDEQTDRQMCTYIGEMRGGTVICKGLCHPGLFEHFVKNPRGENKKKEMIDVRRFAYSMW